MRVPHSVDTLDRASRRGRFFGLSGLPAFQTPPRFFRPARVTRRVLFVVSVWIVQIFESTAYLWITSPTFFRPTPTNSAASLRSSVKFLGPLSSAPRTAWTMGSSAKYSLRAASSAFTSTGLSRNSIRPSLRVHLEGQIAHLGAHLVVSKSHGLAAVGADVHGGLQIGQVVNVVAHVADAFEDRPTMPEKADSAVPETAF